MKKKSIKINLNEVPPEVMEVMLMRAAFDFVGLETMNQINSVIEKHPEYFPWEHKYKSVPPEVHEAYRKEIDPNYGKPIEFRSPMDVKSEPQTWTPGAFNEKIFEDFAKDYEQSRADEFNERKRRERIWDKHYKKYGLKYGGQ